MWRAATRMPLRSLGVLETRSPVRNPLCQFTGVHSIRGKPASKDTDGRQPEALLRVGWRWGVRPRRPRWESPPRCADHVRPFRQRGSIDRQGGRQQVQPWIDSRDRPHRHGHGAVNRVLVVRQGERAGRVRRRIVGFEVGLHRGCRRRSARPSEARRWKRREQDRGDGRVLLPSRTVSPAMAKVGSAPGQSSAASDGSRRDS